MLVRLMGRNLRDWHAFTVFRTDVAHSDQLVQVVQQLIHVLEVRAVSDRIVLYCQVLITLADHS